MFTPSLEEAEQTKSFDPSQALANIKHEGFAQMVASGMEKGKAYLAVGYKPKNLANAQTLAAHLCSEPLVMSRIEHLKPSFNEAFMQTVQINVQSDILTRAGRIRGYAELERMILHTMLDRANDAQNQDIPGIRNGLMMVSAVTTERKAGAVTASIIKREFKTDGPLIRALLEVRKQAAIELRQWVERKEDLKSINPRDLTNDQLDTLLGRIGETQRDVMLQAGKLIDIPVEDYIKVDSKPAKKVDPFA